MRPITRVSEGATSIGGIGDVDLNACVKRKELEVLIAAAITVVFGVANKVLYKLALVPLRNYPFFLAQFATFGCDAATFGGETLV